MGFLSSMQEIFPIFRPPFFCGGRIPTSHASLVILSLYGFAIAPSSRRRLPRTYQTAVVLDGEMAATFSSMSMPQPGLW